MLFTYFCIWSVDSFLHKICHEPKLNLYTKATLNYFCSAWHNCLGQVLKAKGFCQFILPFQEHKHLRLERSLYKSMTLKMYRVSATDLIRPWLKIGSVTK